MPHSESSVRTARGSLAASTCMVWLRADSRKRSTSCTPPLLRLFLPLLSEPELELLDFLFLLLSSLTSSSSPSSPEEEEVRGRGPLARRRRSSSFLVFSFLRAKLVDSDMESEPTPSIKMSHYCTYRTILYAGSRIMIFIHPGSQIQQQHQKTRGKFFCPPIFCSQKKLILKIILLLNRLINFFKAKILRIQYFLPKNLSLSYQKYGFGIRDPRSGKSLFQIPGQKGTGSRIRNTAPYYRLQIP